MFRKIANGFIDLIFPLNCALCGQFDPVTQRQPLCRACLQSIPYARPPFCLKCARHLKTYNEQGLCPDCLLQPPAFDGAWAFTRYEPPMTNMIRAFKFHNKTALRKTFAHIARTFLTRYGLELTADMLIPVPIHPVRLRERGYNQSALLAQSLAGLTGIPLATAILKKHLLIPRQSELRRKERWTNIQGAFRIENSSLARNKHIILVDDLLTTGATASEAAGALKQAGAAKVELIALSAA
ncbi:MAG: ComF family protein [Candidatus Omnitrophica bacterium]|nr:ComF family protein [Candidatus Omnitrophota bacterium]